MIRRRGVRQSASLNGKHFSDLDRLAALRVSMGLSCSPPEASRFSCWFQREDSVEEGCWVTTLLGLLEGLCLFQGSLRVFAWPIGGILGLGLRPDCPSVEGVSELWLVLPCEDSTAACNS